MAGFEPGRRAVLVAGARPLGVDPLSGGPEEFARYIKSELKRWGDVATAAGLKS